MAKELLNVHEACELLGGISRATFYRLLKNGEFGVEGEVKKKVGGSVFFRRGRLEFYLESKNLNPY
jgi:excisionase family DNA binding protein